MIHLKLHKSKTLWYSKYWLYFIDFQERYKEPWSLWRKLVCLNMASLAFRTQAVPDSQMFPGLIQHLWCDLFKCSSNLVPQIFNVSWVLSVQTKKSGGLRSGELGGQAVGPHDHNNFHWNFGYGIDEPQGTSAEHYTHVCTIAAPLSHSEIAQTIGHILLSAAESALFLNFCNSGASTGPTLQWHIYW
jgi:hypothetical protein